MTSNNISRDSIATKVFGRKFSSLTTDNQQWVNKTMLALSRVSRQGMDTEHMLNTAAMQETAKIVKQLKEIAVNPGDVIELPKGIYQDAARVIRYQSEVMGKGKTFSKSELARLSNEISRKFGDVDKEVIAGIADYLTNTKGSYKGIGPRTLRRELRSFLDYEKLDKLSSREIVAARDIVVSSIFDKWSKGNLTSFIRPKIKEEIVRPIDKSDLQKTINALETLEHLQANPSKLGSPVVRQALKNLGLSPKDIVDTPAKEAVSEIQHAAYKFAAKQAQRRTDIRLGGGLRRRPRLLTRASPEYLESIPSSYPTSGIGKRATIRSKWSGGSFKTDLKRIMEQSDSGGDYSSKSYDGLKSELQDFSFSTAEEEYGSWTRELQKKYTKFSDKGPGSIVEYSTGLISPYVVTGSLRESKSQLQNAYHDWYLERMTEHEDTRAAYVKKYGRYYGKAFHEAGVPFDKADEMIMTYGADKAVLNAELSSYTSGLNRSMQPITVEKDEIKPFNARNSLAGFYGDLTSESPVTKTISNFLNRYPGATPADLPDEIRRLVQTGVPGATRVGVVGSKSWDNESFMRKYFNKNWNPDNVMVTSSEVGKGLKESSFGAAYQASNWAHHSKALMHKFPVREEWARTTGGTQYKRDFTTADVINNSDEVLAFFDEAYLSPSGKKQLTNLLDAIGDKPCRIVWVPTNLTKGKGSTPFVNMLPRFSNRSNITFDAMYPGALPKSTIADIISHDIPLKYLAKGGSLKHGQNAIVGEAGPEMLVSRPGGGFDVIPNEHLRFLAEGTLPLSAYARNVTGEAQPDPHDYYDAATGEIWPSVTKIKNMGKNYNGGDYYGHVGAVAHYHAAKAMGERFGIDTEHVEFPKVAPGADLGGKYHSVEDILRNGKMISDKFIELADQMGFIPTMIEQRFVNTQEKYSGTLDIGGFIRDEIGNLIPTIADFKTSTNVTSDFAEQIAAYADFFQDAVKGFVIHTSRDMTKFGVHEMDLVKGFESWQAKLQKYNATMGPRPLAGAPTDAGEDAAAARIFDLASRRMEVYDIASGERYERQGIGATTPGHARALSKIFPKFNAVGATPDETWDKNPSRLSIFTERMHEMYASLGGPGVHPTIKSAWGELTNAGWDDKSLAMLAGAPKGMVEDDSDTIKLFDKIYQSLKPIGFNQKLLDTGKNMDTMLWNDSIAMLNILEEAGKSFESIPRFADKLKASSPIPGQGTPSGNYRSSASPGGSPNGSYNPTGPKPRDYEAEFRQKYLDNVPHATGARRAMERVPIMGLPWQMKRKERVYGERILAAGTDETDWQNLAPRGYWKLLEKEDQARKNYLRSIRGATTSFLIAQHVMRVFGQTSRVYNKASEAVGKGFGYIADMFLLPILPIIGPVVKGLVGFGNIIRQFPVIAGVGLIALGKVIYEGYQWYKTLKELPDAIHNVTESILNFMYNISPVPTGMPETGPDNTPNQYRKPIGPEPQKEGAYTRVKKFLGFSSGGVVPGVGNKDSVLAMLTPGEVVISKNDLPHYADGGIVGGVMGGILSGYSSLMSSDVAQSVIGGLSIVSKSIGAMMAPLAPALAVGAIGGRGFNMVKNAIDQGTKVTSAVSEGGFSAIRTIAAAQLVGTLTALGPLLPLAAAAAGIYAWTQGFPAFPSATFDAIKNSIKSLTDWLKSRFEIKSEVGPKVEKGATEPKYGDHASRKWMLDDSKVSDSKLKVAEETRRIESSKKYQKLLEGGTKTVEETAKVAEESTKPKLSFEPAEWIKNFKLPSLSDVKGVLKDSVSGVSSMAAVGGVMGAMESKNPLDWITSAGLGGAAQYAFNVGSKIPVISSVMGPLAAALIPGFSSSIANAVTKGEGPLSPSNYVAGLKGNQTANDIIEMASRLGLSSVIGGMVFKGSDLVTPEMVANLESDNTVLVNELKGINDKLKQPTINQIEIKMENSDPYALFQQFLTWMSTVGNTTGVQRTM